MLIGQSLGLSFTDYLATAALPSALGLVAVWAVIALQVRGRWSGSRAVGTAVDPSEIPGFERWQTAKGLGVAIDWRRHARTGVPITLVTLAIAPGLLALGARGGP